MKRFLLIPFLFVVGCHALDTGKIDPLEKEKLLRIQSQLKLIEISYQQQTAPMAAEQKEIVTSICKRVNAELKDCKIDLDKGIAIKAIQKEVEKGK